VKALLRKIASFFFRLALGTLATVFLAATCLLLYLVVAGIPDWAAQQLLREANARSPYVVQASSMRLDLVNGLRLEGVQVFRKGIVGPPGVAARYLSVIPDLSAVLEGRLCIRGVLIDNGVVLLDQLQDRSAPPSAPSALPSFSLNVEIRDCRVDFVDVRSLSCRVEGFGMLTHVSQLRAKVEHGGGAGVVSGDITYDAASDLVRGGIQAAAEPSLLLPLLRRWEMNDAIGYVELLSFSNSAPRCDFTFLRLGGKSPLLRASGGFRLQEFKYRGVDLLRCEGRFNFMSSESHTEIRVDPLLIVREEGTLRGAVALYPDDGLIDFRAESSLDPAALSRMLELVPEDVLSLFRFDGGMRISIAGVLDYVNQERTTIDGKAAGNGITAWKFVADECSFDISVRGCTNQISKLRGRVYGGDLVSKITIISPSPAYTNLRYTVAVGLANAEFKQLARALMDAGYEDYSGRMSFFTKISGEVNDHPLRSIRGQGGLRIREGRVFTLPIFGGFSEYMTKVIPGLDLVLRQTEARMDFVVKNGKISSNRIEIEGGVLSIAGRGDCIPYPDTQLDYTIQVKLLRDNLVGKLVRLPTWIISKLFEFRLKGTIDEPRWYLVNFSSDLLSRMGLRKERALERPLEPARKPTKPPQQKHPPKEPEWPEGLIPKSGIL